MKELENNALFWQKLDTIYLSSDFTVVNKKGSSDPKSFGEQYPCDYGYLKTLSTDNETAIPCFKGESFKEVDAIVVVADILSRSLSVVPLIGCSAEEEEAILNFLNQNDHQKTVLVKRSNVVPSWSLSDD